MFIMAATRLILFFHPASAAFIPGIAKKIEPRFLTHTIMIRLHYPRRDRHIHHGQYPDKYFLHL